MQMETILRVPYPYLILSIRLTCVVVSWQLLLTVLHEPSVCPQQYRHPSLSSIKTPV